MNQPLSAGWPRVVATDLDGTIVRSDGTISARMRDALTSAEAAGALVVLVTGRPPRWLSGIPDATGHSGLAVCANGSQSKNRHAFSQVILWISSSEQPASWSSPHACSGEFGHVVSVCG